jgi:subtilisin family serine protease
MGIKGIVVFASIGISALGCTKGLDLFDARRTSQAPQSKTETGVLVRGVDEAAVVSLLERHAEVRFRILSAKDKFYELYGIDTRTVQGELADAHVAKNEFFAWGEPTPSERLKLLATNKLGPLQKCEEGENPPQAAITVHSPKEEMTKSLLRRGAIIDLDGRTSVNTHSPNQPLRMGWIVLSPRGAREPEKGVAGPVLKIKAESMGAYGIGLVVQDERNVCHLELLEFAVTDDADYAGPGDNQPLPIDLEQMTHLKELHAADAWRISQGKNVIIAIIDSGVNFNHPHLRQNILVNAKETKNGIDDDGNGFVDDVVGWDFAFGDASPFDDEGHGSHVAGLAAGSTFGLAKAARILPVKAMGAMGGDAGTIAAAIRYAVDRDARILNLSLGTYHGPHPEVLAAVEYAESKGVLLVTAAGNGDPNTGIGINTDEVPHYPSTLPAGNILNVGAKGAGDELAFYSNYGPQTVHVAAPGGDESQRLISTFFDNPAGLIFEKMSGTSMAAPLVAGLAAQVLALHPKYTPEQVRELIVKSGREAPSLRGFIQSERWVDALATLTMEL